MRNPQPALREHNRTTAHAHPAPRRWNYCCAISTAHRITGLRGNKHCRHRACCPPNRRTQPQQHRCAHSHRPLTRQASLLRCGSCVAGSLSADNSFRKADKCFRKADALVPLFGRATRE